MKKILGTTLAAALLIPGPANAEILKNLKVNGQLDIQATSAQNTTDFSKNNKAIQNQGLNDRVGATISRVLVDLNWDLLDDVHSIVTLRKNDRAWGAAGGVGQGAGGSQAIGAGGVQANTYVDRAAVTIDKLGGGVDLTAGRQYYGDSGDLIFYAGPVEGSFGLATTAIDAFRFDWANDFLTLTGLAATTAGGTVTAGTANTHIRGLDAMWKSLPMKTHTYIWNQVKQDNAGNTAGTNNLWVYGVKLRGEAMGGWLSVDAAANGGIDRASITNNTCGTAGCNANSSAYTGKALLADAGYNAEMSGIGALTPWVNFGFGTGRSSQVENRNEGFTAINSDYRPGVLNRRFDGNVRGLGGAAAVGAANTFHTNGLNNRVVYGTGVNFTPAAWEKLTVGAQLWHFNLQRLTHTNALQGTAANPTQNGAKHLGTELGLTIDWKHSENVKFGAGWAQYMPGGRVKQLHRNNTGANGTGINPSSVVFGDLSVKF